MPLCSFRTSTTAMPAMELQDSTLASSEELQLNQTVSKFDCFLEKEANGKCSTLRPTRTR
jgi:hypothetical protein